jgi:hypothetical protein
MFGSIRPVGRINRYSSVLHLLTEDLTGNACASGDASDSQFHRCNAEAGLEPTKSCL